MNGSLSFMAAVFIQQKTFCQNKYFIINLFILYFPLFYFLQCTCSSIISDFVLSDLLKFWWALMEIKRSLTYVDLQCDELLNTCTGDIDLRSCKLIHCPEVVSWNAKLMKKNPSYWSSSWFMHISSPYYTVPDIPGSMSHCVHQSCLCMLVCVTKHQLSFTR